MDREFAYRMPTWWIAAMSVAAVANLVGAMGLLMVVVGQPARPSAHVGADDLASVWYHLWMPCVWLVVCGVLVTILVRGLLLASRGGVLVSGVGMTVRDWLGRERQVFWQQIDELEVTGPAAGLDRGLSRLWVRFGNERLRVHWGLDGIEDLLDEAIQRAGLVRKRQDGWGTLYTRPTPWADRRVDP
jgi:hypothetical protein